MLELYYFSDLNEDKIASGAVTTMKKSRLQRTMSLRPEVSHEHTSRAREELSATESMPIANGHSKKSKKWHKLLSVIKQTRSFDEQRCVTPPAPKGLSSVRVRVTDMNEARLSRHNSMASSEDIHLKKLRRQLHSASAGSAPHIDDIDHGSPATTIKKASFASCPNLLRQPSPPLNQTTLQDNSTSVKLLTRMGRKNGGGLRVEQTSPQRLVVPNVFVTSFTHSQSGGPPMQQSNSAPNLAGTRLRGDDQKPALVKSYSDGPVATAHDLAGINDIEEITLKEHFRNDHMSQVLEFMYVGSVESAYNSHLLCQLNITSVIDISNMLPEDIPSERKSNCPCLCGNVIKHSRAKLSIGVNEMNSGDLENYFDEMNKFIEGARKNGRSILLHCYYGNCRAPAAAIQYLMTYCGMSLRKAFFLLKRHRHSVELRKDVQFTLQRLEMKLNRSSTSTKDFDTDLFSFSGTRSRRTAWSECSDT